MKPCKETALSNPETIHIGPSCSISQFAQLLQPITPAAGAGKVPRKGIRCSSAACSWATDRWAYMCGAHVSGTPLQGTQLQRISFQVPRVRPRKLLLAPNAKSIISQCIGAGAGFVSHMRNYFSRFSQFPHLISCQLSSFAYVAWSLILWKRRVGTALIQIKVCCVDWKPTI